MSTRVFVTDIVPQREAGDPRAAADQAAQDAADDAAKVAIAVADAARHELELEEADAANVANLAPGGDEVVGRSALLSRLASAGHKSPAFAHKAPNHGGAPAPTGGIEPLADDAPPVGRDLWLQRQARGPRETR